MKYTAQAVLDTVKDSENLSPDRAVEMMGYFEDRREEAESRIKERISEKNLAVIFNAVQSATLTAMMAQGDGYSLLLDKDALQGYSHTILLVVLGMAMDEEWL